MERLTERTGEGQAIPRMDLKNNGHQRCMERLAEYEDFEEIFRSKMTDASCDFLKDKEEFAKWLDRNKWIAKKCDEYARAEEQGKLLKLPCAVVDTAWIVFKGEIFKCMVSKFDIVRNGIFPMLRINETLETISVSMKTFEKAWFLTKEAAEAALKELERGKGNETD